MSRSISLSGVGFLFGTVASLICNSYVHQLGVVPGILCHSAVGIATGFGVGVIGGLSFLGGGILAAGTAAVFRSAALAAVVFGGSVIAGCLVGGSGAYQLTTKLIDRYVVAPAPIAAQAPAQQPVRPQANDDMKTIIVPAPKANP